MSNKQSKKYFNEIGFSENKNIQPDDLNNLREKVKLEFSIENSSKANYSIKAILFDEQNINFNSENIESHADFSLKLNF